MSAYPPAPRTLFLLADSIPYNNTLGLALVPFAETCWPYDFQLKKVLCVIARCSLLNLLQSLPCVCFEALRSTFLNMGLNKRKLY